MIAIDVDGTLTRSNISFLFGKYLYEKGELSIGRALLLTLLYFFHCAGMVSLRSLHLKAFSLLFKGKSALVFEKLAQHFFLSSKHLIRADVFEKVCLSGKAGERIVLLSASPDFLVKKVAEALSIPEWYGTEYCIDVQGNFSSVGTIMTGEEKATLMQEKKEQERLVAVTDSAQDLPLLLLADEVLVVSPDRALRKRALREHWKIVR